MDAAAQRSLVSEGVSLTYASEELVRRTLQYNDWNLAKAVDRILTDGGCFQPPADDDFAAAIAASMTSGESYYTCIGSQKWQV